MLRPLLGNRIISGPADAAEVCLMVAHANMIHTTVADLGPASVHAAHSTLIELAKAVAGHRFDDAEPQLAPALAQATKALAYSRITDPELSATTLVRDLNVSARTLQRAFAAVGESVTAYIRILKTYARVFINDMDGSLKVLRELVGRDPDLRDPFGELEISAIGDFCVVAGTDEALKRYLGTDAKTAR